MQVFKLNFLCTDDYLYMSIYLCTVRWNTQMLIHTKCSREKNTIRTCVLSCKTIQFNSHLTFVMRINFDELIQLCGDFRG